MKFLDKNFLLKSKTAQLLYHNYARDLPIIDYHNHLNPKDIAEDKSFKNITEIWLIGDHYKWRAMRANGIDETLITGNKSDREKFTAWAKTVPYTMRNPLYHWTHLELQRYFNITELLNEKSANSIFNKTEKLLNQKDFSVQSLLTKMSVEVVCTTDDLIDELKYHKKLKNSNLKTKLLPTFRPDNALLIDKENYQEYIVKLEKVINSKINSFSDLVIALEKRIDYFNDLGCKLADCGLSHIPFIETTENSTVIFEKRLKNQPLTQIEINYFQVALLVELSRMYSEKNWVMQLHLGAIRDNNENLLSKVGADAGCDSIGDFEQAKGLSQFLNKLSSKQQLPKTILYNLNPRDNEVFATMAGNFTSNGGINRVQYGAAWWFLDQKNGMEKQLNTLSNIGLLSRFVGMLTDSRSFLSFPRHEYFRRILCSLLGEDIENGELPNDIDFIGKMVADICYYNAKNYFDFD